MTGGSWYRTAPVWAGTKMDTPPATGTAGGVRSEVTHPGLVRLLPIGGFTKIRADPPLEPVQQRLAP